ncbi:MAG: hypothetical protein LBJ94_02720 [Puniceicoccales bacterium]|nr:hypothetical protein [Puniceicoccales bacterium]
MDSESLQRSERRQSGDGQHYAFEGWIDGLQINFDRQIAGMQEGMLRRQLRALCGVQYVP